MKTYFSYGIAEINAMIPYERDVMFDMSFDEMERRANPKQQE